MEYINADKLREKITEQMDSVPREVGRGAGTITSTGYGMMRAFQIVHSIIDYLQQEQPETNEVEKALSLQIQAYLTTASDELYAPGKRLYTKEHHEGIHGCMKMWQKLHQYYFSTKHERPESGSSEKPNDHQPEVDLEKEIKAYIKDNFTITDEVAQIPEEDRRYSMWVDDMRAVARHFYELGLKARKED